MSYNITAMPINDKPNRVNLTGLNLTYTDIYYKMIFASGCSSVWYERYVGDVEAAGSNPVTPTIYKDQKDGILFSRLLCFLAGFLALSVVWSVIVTALKSHRPSRLESYSNIPRGEPEARPAYYVRISKKALILVFICPVSACE